MTDEFKERFEESLKWLVEEQKVKGTGDCGFMMNFQCLARNSTKIPTFMSSLCQLPAVTCGYAEKEQIIIMTANGKSLEPTRDLLRDEGGVDTEDKRYNIIGCEDVPHVGQDVANGKKVKVVGCYPSVAF